MDIFTIIGIIGFVLYALKPRSDWGGKHRSKTKPVKFLPRISRTYKAKLPKNKYYFF